MLTEAEKKWLKERGDRICKFCIHCLGYRGISPCLDWWDDTCVMDITLEEFRDAAEFEANVSAKMTRITVGDLPCGVDPDNYDCQKPHFRKYNTEERAIGCDMCFIMTARLAVEEEM